MLAKGNREREGAAQARQHIAHRFDRIGPGLDLGGDQVGDDFGIGLALEHPACRCQFGTQFLVVLDDAVVDDRDLAGGVGVGIGRSRRAVGGPAGVGDADDAGRGIAGQHRSEIGKLALGPATHQRTIVQRADPGAVIAAILHPLEAVDQPVGHAGRAHDPDNSAHSSRWSYIVVSAALASRAAWARSRMQPAAMPRRQRPVAAHGFREKISFPAYSPFFGRYPSHQCDRG